MSFRRTNRAGSITLKSRVTLHATLFSLLWALGSQALQATQAEGEPERNQRTEPRSATTLDLAAPDIREIFSDSQIEIPLGQSDHYNLEHLEVEALRLDDLPLQDRSASAFQTLVSVALWLITPSPTLAWRMNSAPDATDPQRPPPAIQSLHHPSFPPPESRR